MSFRKNFQSFVLIFGLTAALSMSTSLKASATPVEDLTIPGQEALQEIVQEQEETVVMGEDEENESEYSIPANKVAIEYSGKIDATTGEAAIGSAVNMGEDYFILKRDELAFNAKKHQFHLLVGNRGVYCNVPSDAVLSNGKIIQFAPDEGVTIEVQYDGKAVEDTKQTEFTEPGEYILTMFNHADSRERSVRFVILDEKVHDLKEYRLPHGFEYTKILLDGERKSTSYNNYYDFLEEGHYELQWENSMINQTFVTEFILDFTPPNLELPEVRNDGTATGQVSFEDLEEGEYVRWIRNSRDEGRIEDASEVLTEHGHYAVRVYDEAGNYTEYSFEIEGYFDVNAVLAVIFVIVLAASGFFYCRRLRTHMRVG